MRETHFKELFRTTVDYNWNSILRLTGLAEYTVSTKGSIEAKIEFEDVQLVTRYHPHCEG